MMIVVVVEGVMWWRYGGSGGGGNVIGSRGLAMEMDGDCISGGRW